MDGLIVNEPYASMIINNEKKWELRSRKPPLDKINSEILLLSKGNMLGTIKISEVEGPLDGDTLKKNYHLHRSAIDDIDEDEEFFAWKLELCKTFDNVKL